MFCYAKEHMGRILAPDASTAIQQWSIAAREAIHDRSADFSQLAWFTLHRTVPLYRYRLVSNGAYLTRAFFT